MPAPAPISAGFLTNRIGKTSIRRDSGMLPMRAWVATLAGRRALNACLTGQTSLATLGEAGGGLVC